MWDFIEFRRMVTPSIIEGIFALLVFIAVPIGVIGFLGDWPLLGPLAAIVAIIVGRIVLESMIVVFKIHSALTELNRKMDDLMVLIDESADE